MKKKDAQRVVFIQYGIFCALLVTVDVVMTNFWPYDGWRDFSSVLLLAILNAVRGGFEAGYKAGLADKNHCGDANEK